jgi:hypothetical protein
MRRTRLSARGDQSRQNARHRGSTRLILRDPLRHECPQDQSRAVNIAGTRAEECRFFLGDTLNEIFAERVAQRQTSTLDERLQHGIELAR